MSVPGTTLTSSTSEKVRFFAASTLGETMLWVEEGMYEFELSVLAFDGEKSGRDGETLCANVDRDATGSNVVVLGEDFVVHHVDSENAVCGSAMVIDGGYFEVYSLWVADNGYTEAQKPDWNFPYGDGLTVNKCEGGYVHNVDSFDNTDIGIVFGYGYDCWGLWNWVEQTYQYAFAGIHIAAGGSPNTQFTHEGALYQYNDVETAEDGLSAAMIIGHHPWNDDYDMTDSGDVIDNELEGAVVNLTIDGVRNGYVADNDLYNDRGSAGLWECAFQGPYTAADFENGLTKPSGGAVVTYHNLDCQIF